MADLWTVESARKFLWALKRQESKTPGRYNVRVAPAANFLLHYVLTYIAGTQHGRARETWILLCTVNHMISMYTSKNTVGIQKRIGTHTGYEDDNNRAID